MSKGEKLLKAGLLMDLLEGALGIRVEEESVRKLATKWDRLVEWLWENRQRWMSSAPTLPEARTRPDIATFMGKLALKPGGKYLRWRVLRTDEPHRYTDDDGTKREILCDRYVVMDGTHDIAEVIADKEGAVRWVFVYRAQNLVHLIEASIKQGVKIIS